MGVSENKEMRSRRRGEKLWKIRRGDIKEMRERKSR